MRSRDTDSLSEQRWLARVRGARGLTPEQEQASVDRISARLREKAQAMRREIAEMRSEHSRHKAIRQAAGLLSHEQCRRMVEELAR